MTILLKAYPSLAVIAITVQINMFYKRGNTDQNVSSVILKVEKYFEH